MAVSVPMLRKNGWEFDLTNIKNNVTTCLRNYTIERKSWPVALATQDRAHRPSGFWMLGFQIFICMYAFSCYWYRPYNPIWAHHPSKKLYHIFKGFIVSELILN
jgi:hypothetical protein